MRKLALASTALLGLGMLASAPAEARGWGYGGGYGHGGYGYRGVGTNCCHPKIMPKVGWTQALTYLLLLHYPFH